MFQSTDRNQTGKRMKPANLLARNRATLKLLFVGMLSLAMLIPLVMIRSVVLERQNMQLTASNTIANRWGGSQAVSGLVLLTRQQVEIRHDRRTEIGMEWQANVLQEVVMDASLITEWRYLGIYEVPVYTAVVSLQGRIDWDQVDGLQAEGDLVFWLPLGDVRGVREVSALVFGEIEIPARPLSIAANSITGLQFTLPAADRARAGNAYRLEIKLAGSNSLTFLPLADTTRVSLHADWPHPEFVGQFLPTERSITDESTRANWQLLAVDSTDRRNTLQF